MDARYSSGTRVLFVQPGKGVGGAKISLRHLLQGLPDGVLGYVALSRPPDAAYERSLTGAAHQFRYQYLPDWLRRKDRSVLQRLTGVLYTLYLGGFLRPVLGLARWIVREKIDLVYTNNITSPVGALAARITGRPHLWHIREPFGASTYFPLKVNDALAVSLIDRLSARIVCNSRYTGAIFQEHGAGFQVVLNGVDCQSLENGAARGAELRHSLGFSADEFVIAMVGSIRSAVKEHALFLEAMDLLPPGVQRFRFVIFGGSLDFDASPYARSVKQKADSLSIEEQLVWVDYIEDAPAMMNSFDLLVHPTAGEGSGRVIMEAMAAGRPVVAVDSGGVAELIEDHRTGLLVAPRRADLLAQAVSEIVSDAGLRTSLAQNAALHAREHFDRFKNQQTLNQVICDLCQAGSGSRHE